MALSLVRVRREGRVVGEAGAGGGGAGEARDAVRG